MAAELRANPVPEDLDGVLGRAHEVLDGVDLSQWRVIDSSVCLLLMTSEDMKPPTLQQQRLAVEAPVLLKALLELLHEDDGADAG